MGWMKTNINNINNSYLTGVGTLNAADIAVRERGGEREGEGEGEGEGERGGKRGDQINLKCTYKDTIFSTSCTVYYYLWELES